MGRHTQREGFINEFGRVGDTEMFLPELFQSPEHLLGDIRTPGEERLCVEFPKVTDHLMVRGLQKMFRVKGRNLTFMKSHSVAMSFAED